MNATALISVMMASAVRGSRMSIKERIGIGLLVTWIAYLWFLHPAPSELDLCSTEGRDRFVAIYKSDALLIPECPYGFK